MARFKDLALDTTDQAVSVDFWAAVLGLDADPRDPGEPQPLRGAEPGQTVWVNVVPEPPLTKARVHLDVHAASVEEVLSLGAEVVQRHEHWTWLRAPDGLDLCVFVRDTVPAHRLYEVVVDCRDPGAQARWWADRLGLVAEPDPSNPWWGMSGEQLPFDCFVFVPVPEPRTVKNRVHWDVWGTVEEFTDAGATVVAPRDADRDWDVLADPEGNEFCVFAQD
ncbi:hypothetical protein CGZ93_10320 [Enemella dayhoffiae]|uniref:Glyoxalase-like domain-containing protein n=1 Tax=Enemella dayhoffiae TaxID=2016507 RepID=A0A255H1D1_9ACTN|nr:VOC family protein [Enemella dayhoffiae]OYO21525.1 hypothetical protein CGZ93_10320 [Enemella dayhoffiae]